MPKIHPNYYTNITSKNTVVLSWRQIFEFSTMTTTFTHFLILQKISSFFISLSHSSLEEILRISFDEKTKKVFMFLDLKINCKTIDQIGSKMELKMKEEWLKWKLCSVSLVVKTYLKYEVKYIPLFYII